MPSAAARVVGMLLVPILGLLATASGAVPGPVMLGPEGSVAAQQAAEESLAPATDTTFRTITIDGMPRQYLVVGPDTVTEPLPAIVVLHGRFVSPEQEAKRSGFLPLAQRAQAILLFPAGYDQSWNDESGCCGQAAADDIDDVRFVAELAREARGRLLVRPGQVSLVGYSNGAKLAFRVLCAHPWMYDSAATFAALPPEPCELPDPPPVSTLIALGDEDIEADTSDPPPDPAEALDATVRTWRDRNNCPTTESATIAPPALVRTWAGCADETMVRSVLYQGISHEWPASHDVSAPFAVDVGPDAAAATLMWQFFTDARR